MKKLIMVTILLIGYCYAPVSAQADSTTLGKRVDEFAKKRFDFLQHHSDVAVTLGGDPNLFIFGDEEHGYSSVP